MFPLYLIRGRNYLFRPAFLRLPICLFCFPKPLTRVCGKGPAEKKSWESFVTSPRIEAGGMTWPPHVPTTHQQTITFIQLCFTFLYPVHGLVARCRAFLAYSSPTSILLGLFSFPYLPLFPIVLRSRGSLPSVGFPSARGRHNVVLIPIAPVPGDDLTKACVTVFFFNVFNACLYSSPQAREASLIRPLTTLFLVRQTGGSPAVSVFSTREFSPF